MLLKMCIHTIGAIALAAALVGDALAQRPRRVEGGKTTKGLSSAALQGDETIQLTTEMVNILFTAVDSRNRFVGDLTDAEITIAEDGVKQEVFAFRRETNLPLSVAVLIDMSSSQEYTFGEEKRAALTFVHRVLRPNRDWAGLATFREDTDFVLGMTTRAERISDAFNGLSWGSGPVRGSQAGATALFDAIAITASGLFPEVASYDDPSQAVRRAIIVLTDGDDTASDRTAQQAIEEALRAGVIVYAVGIGDRFRSTEVKKDVLESLAAQTGGRAYLPDSATALVEAFAQIEAELRTQYLVAYEPSNSLRDGSFRQVQVTVPGRNGIRIYHRRGYYAPKAVPEKVPAASKRP
jgi:Ca-activated chloride channel family protein